MSSLSLGDLPSQIDLSSSIQILIPNSIVDFGLIQNPTTDSSQQSQFGYNFDLFSIKINQFLSIFDLLIKIRLKMIN